MEGSLLVESRVANPMLHESGMWMGVGGGGGGSGRMVTGLLQMMLPETLVLLLLLLRLLLLLVEECGLDRIRRRRSHDRLLRRRLLLRLLLCCLHERTRHVRLGKLLWLVLTVLTQAGGVGDRPRTFHLVLIRMIVVHRNVPLLLLLVMLVLVGRAGQGGRADDRTTNTVVLGGRVRWCEYRRHRARFLLDVGERKLGREIW